MTRTDMRGVPMTGADAFALERYETALRQFQSYMGDPVATLDETLKAAPAFVGGHLMKALVLYTLSERQFAAMAADALAAARRHAAHANGRERGLMAATQLLVDGAWHGASNAFDRVLVDYPRDALTVQVAHLMDFFRGDTLNLRNRISRVLPHWNSSMPGYSYILGMHAFGLEEMNQYPEAEATAMRALSIEPRDGWAVHAAVHVMEMQGRIEEGVRFLTTRQSDWAPDNGFAFHNFWHLALFYMDSARYHRALELYDAHVHAGPATFVLSLIDATALLWRLELEGVDVADRFASVADDWQARLDGSGFYAFNDAHAAMAFVATGREAALAQLAEEMNRAASRADANGAMTRDVGIPFVEGVVAFGHGRYADAVDSFEAMRDGAYRFGGSQAQRDLITLTLIEAALRAGDTARARHYVAERLVHKPRSQWGGRLWERAQLAPRLPVAA